MEGEELKKSIVHILKNGSCQDLNISQKIKDIFKTAVEIDPMEHVKMVGALQECVDESISKTINFSSTTTVEEIKKIYLAAHGAGLKGVAIYVNHHSKRQPVQLKEE